MELMTSSGAPRRLLVLAALCLAGLVASVYLTTLFYGLQNGTAEFHSICNVGQSMNCDIVAASRWAELVAGLPLSSFSAGWFVALFILSLMARNPFWRREGTRGLFVTTLAGSLISLIYFTIMASVLKTWCLMCLFIEGVNLVGFGIVLSLKPEGTGEHALDKPKWKIMAGVIAGSVAALVLVLKLSNSSEGQSDDRLDQALTAILASPPVAVSSGPESPSLGNPNAPITIVEFSDFQCPHCRHGAHLLDGVLKRYPDQVRVVLRNFPLDASCNRILQGQGPGHRAACDAARTVYCAYKQGKFAEIYETLFENQEMLESKSPIEFTKNTGINHDQLVACLSSAETNERILKDVEDGIQLGVQGTPTFFINGHKVEMPLPVKAWGQLIEKLTKP